MHGDVFCPRGIHFLFMKQKGRISFGFTFLPGLFCYCCCWVFLQTSDQALVFHACAVQGIITNLPMVVGYSVFLCFVHMQAKCRA